MAKRSLFLIALGLLLTACSSAPPSTTLSALSLVGETNAPALDAAERGDLGLPTIIFFHARWCQICQEANPVMDELAREHRDEVAVVRMDIDDATARAAVTRYRVSATPTFVLLSSRGDVLAAIPGWPGKGSMEEMIAQLTKTAP